MAENLGVTVDELLAGERSPKTAQAGEETRKYLEDRRRRQYQIALAVSVLFLLLTLPYGVLYQGQAIMMPLYWVFLGVSVTYYIAANIWFPGRETLRQRVGFCAGWMAVSWGIPCRMLWHFVLYAFESGWGWRDQLAQRLAENYCETHAITVTAVCQEFYMHYKQQIWEQMFHYKWILAPVSAALMILLGIWIGRITWNVQHRERKRYESKS